jgi:hypothetical protein
LPLDIVTGVWDLVLEFLARIMPNITAKIAIFGGKIRVFDCIVLNI